MAHQARAYPGLCSMKRPEVLLLHPGWDAGPSQDYPPPPALNSPDLFIHFGGERYFENRSSRPKPQYNVLGQLRSRTQTARSGDEDTNQGTAHLPDPRSTDRRCWFIYKPHPLSSVEALYNSLIQDQGSLPSTKCLQTEEIIQREVFQDLSKIWKEQSCNNVIEDWLNGW